MHLASMACMFAMGLEVKSPDCHMLQPIALLAFLAVHGRIARRGSMAPMKMVIAGLPAITCNLLCNDLFT